MKVSDFRQKYKFSEDFHTYPGTKGAVYDVHNLEFIKLAYVLHLYWIGPLHEHAPGLLKFCNQSWDIISSHVSHFRDNKKRRNPARLAKSTFETLQSWLADPAHAPPMMALMDIFNKRFDIEAADVRLDFNSLDFQGGGYVSLYLPAEWAEQDPGKLADLCSDLGGTFEFCSGLGGFGVSAGEVEGHTAAVRELYALGRHHPGLDLDSRIWKGLGQGIKGVNWLTFLHPTFIERWGGREKLGQALNLPEVKVVDLPSGIMIQASNTPEIGDTNRGLTCPTYHAVGKILSTIRDRNYPAFIGDERGVYVSDERTQEWLSRFD